MQAGVDASILKEATVRFESRLHAAAAAYVHGLHSLPLAITAAGPAAESVNAFATSGDGAGELYARNTDTGLTKETTCRVGKIRFEMICRTGRGTHCLHLLVVPIRRAI